MKQCVLEDRLCNNCGECDRCDLDPNKTCDNCMQCVEPSTDYKEIIIEKIINTQNS